MSVVLTLWLISVNNQYAAVYIYNKYGMYQKEKSQFLVSTRFNSCYVINFS